MNKQDSKILERLVFKLVSELAKRIENAEGNNFVSVALTGSTVGKRMSYNQDVDLFVVLKKINGENLNNISNDLKRIQKGKLDLEYVPNIPKIAAVFKQITKKYTDKNTGVTYKFTLGNYWGKPARGKKFTIHLHVLGPHSLASLRLRIKKQAVVMANAIYNSKTIRGKNLKSLVKIKVTPKDVLSVLRMLGSRQKLALTSARSNPELALQISIKNLGKISAASLELKNIFVNEAGEAGRLFEKHFNIRHNDLPAKASELKSNKINILKNKDATIDIINKTNILIEQLFALIQKDYNL